MKDQDKHLSHDETRISAAGLCRRDFVKLCLAALAPGSPSTALAKDAAQPKMYTRSLLVDSERRPIRAREIVAGENYVFHYPYVTTPCFLLNLDEQITQATTLSTESGDGYTWAGGVGPDSSLVAFSAICAHKMTHPAREVSFINYRHERVKYLDSEKREHRASQVIFCCSERSVYDARQGARVLAGPAKQPLAAIKLEYEPDRDELYALGTCGGEMFDLFFDKFGERLQLEYQTAQIKKRVGSHSQVIPLDEYCKTQVLC